MPAQLIQLITIACFCVVVSLAQSYTASVWHPASFGATSKLTTTSTDNNVFTDLTVEAIFQTATSMRLRVYPSVLKAGQEMPFVVPDVVIPHNTAAANATTAATNRTYSCSYSTPTQGSSLLSCEEVAAPFTNLISLGNVVFQKQLVSFQTTFSGTTEKLYGYGEHDYHYFINSVDNVTLSLWNTDNGTPWMKPMYGVHPVVFHSDPTSNRHFAVFWANSHAQNLHIEQDTLTYTSVGGIIDLYIITGDTPMSVVQQYHALIGPSAVPPYWSLGIHQCRWGYNNLSEVESVVNGYAAAGIPLDVMWNDIDYMDQFRVFTTDPIRYPEAALKTFVDGLHAKNMRYVQITDPGVAQADNYSVYSSGIANNAFVTTSTDGKPLVNAVWPGWTVFPDFTADAPSAWWGQQIAEYRAKVPIDGMWLDMNELGTFCAGQCDVAVGTPWSADWHTIDWNTFTTAICMPNNCTVVNSSLNYPPVNPLNNGYQLFNKTLDMTGVLSLGSYYQVKAFYGLMEEKASYEALLAQTGERPFLLSRASFAGSGRYTAHWTGDNNAQWAPESGGLVDSIQGVLGSNLWGIPMVGADIGGFGGTTTEELLVRWYQMGVYYTFTRNHHDLNGPGQEPYKFSAAAQEAIKLAIYRKYQLLPYMFTYLVRAHLNQGPVLRHLSMQFPTDELMYNELPQIIIGDAIMVCPVVEQAATGMAVYLPAGDWYLWDEGNYLGVPGNREKSMGVIFDVTAYGEPPTLARGGNVVPIHAKPGMTVVETKASGIALRVFFDSNASAVGQVLLATDAPIESQVVTKVNYIAMGTMRNGSFTSVSVQAPATNPALVQQVQVQFYFPHCDEVFPNTTVNITLNSVLEDPSTITNVSCDKFTYTLPLGNDGSTTFALEWVANLGPVEPPTVPTGGNDDDNHKGVIIGASVGAVAGVAALAAAVYVLKFRRTSRGDYSEVQMRQEL